MERTEEIQEHIHLSRIYLQASKRNLSDGLMEPALYNGIHALELAVKALLIPEVDGPILTHQVGGLLGKYYRNVLGEMRCKRINRIFMIYNVPRYPGMGLPEESEIEETIDFIEHFIQDVVILRYRDVE